MKKRETRKPKLKPPTEMVSSRLIELESKITERWEQRVRAEIPGADEHGSRVIKNALPGFLVKLAGVLASAGGARAAALTICQEHGLQRAEHTLYSPVELVEEFRILREVLFEVLGTVCDLDEECRAILHESIDRGIAESLNGFLRRAGNDPGRTQAHLQESRERYSLALQAGKIGVWELDLVGGGIVCNNRQTHIFGLPTDGGPVTASQLLAQIHPEDREAVSRELDLAVSERRDLRAEFRVVREDGVQHWVRVNARPHYGADGTPRRIVGTSVDITDVAMEQRQRFELIDSLTREREIRERFMDALTHDLRTPLAAAKMSGQILARKAGNPDDVVRHAAKVIDNIDRADGMITDLLDSSRIRAGLAMSVKIAATEIRQLLVATLEELTVIHGNRFVLEGEGEVRGYWDAKGIRRVIENLANNAVKYGRSHEPIVIGYAAEQAEIKLYVANRGDELSAAEMKNLFGLFARTDQARASGSLGWGIGLTVVKGIAEAHGGSVSVASGDSRTVFTLKLPLDARA